MASERAAARVGEGITVSVKRRLKRWMSRAKSGVAPAIRRGLLGFGFLKTVGRVRDRFDPKAKHRLKVRLRRLTSRHWAIAMRVRLAMLNRLIGSRSACFALAETATVFAEFDEWLRRRLRQVRWKEWAASQTGYWRLSGSAPFLRAMPNRYWTDLGVMSISARVCHRSARHRSQWFNSPP